LAIRAGDDPMTFGLFKRMRAAPMAWWIVAAIVLVLHGTAPGPLQLAPIVQLRDAAPAVSTDARDAQRGTLPRVQTRATSAEAGLPKAPLRRWNTGSKPYALPPVAPAVAAPPALAIAPTVTRMARPRLAVRFFDPRGPPIAA
jgi:hypothetical protein